MNDGGLPLLGLRLQPHGAATLCRCRQFTAAPSDVEAAGFFAGAIGAPLTASGAAAVAQPRVPSRVPNGLIFGPGSACAPPLTGDAQSSS